MISLPLFLTALIPLGEHVDLRWTYDLPSQAWSCQAITSGTAGGEISRSPEEVFLPLSDKPYRASTPANSGARNTQPSNPAYIFTGAAPGSPLWIAPQGTPGTGEAWPGMENNQNSGALGEYIETDTRLTQPQTIARPWIKVALKSISYHGPAAQPAFSMWTVSSGIPRVWMATSDGIDASDFFLFSAGSHTHMNWGFSAMGIYRVRLTASAFRGPGQTNPTGESTTRTLTFTVGPYAAWQAPRFSPSDLELPSITGPTADPDGDGMTNLLEFALGTDPLSGTATPDATGLGTPTFSREIIAGVLHEVLTFPRRKANELTTPLLYSVEASSLSPADPWSPVDDATTLSSPPPGSDVNLAATWEILRIQRPISPASLPARFLRLKVTQPD